MKKTVIGVLFLLVYVLGGAFSAMASVSGKSFSIVYSSDERGAITPCG